MLTFIYSDFKWRPIRCFENRGERFILQKKETDEKLSIEDFISFRPGLWGDKHFIFLLHNRISDTLLIFRGALPVVQTPCCSPFVSQVDSLFFFFGPYNRSTFCQAAQISLETCLTNSQILDTRPENRGKNIWSHWLHWPKLSSNLPFGIVSCDIAVFSFCVAGNWFSEL